MTAALIEEARQIHENAHLSDDDLARATGAAPSTARPWLAGSRIPTGERPNVSLSYPRSSNA